MSTCTDVAAHSWITQGPILRLESIHIYEYECIVTAPHRYECYEYTEGTLALRIDTATLRMHRIGFNVLESYGYKKSQVSTERLNAVATGLQQDKCTKTVTNGERFVYMKKGEGV